MAKFLLPFILLVGTAVFYFLQPMQSVETMTRPSASQHGLPWQVELKDGNSRVFGITLGESSLADVIATINLEYELAIMAKQQQAGALELFYSHFKAGQLQGKLIVVIDTSETQLATLKAEAPKSQMLDNGTRKYQLGEHQFLSVQPLPIVSVTFAPTVRLNQEMIELHFGVAEEIVEATEYVTHYLYPALGLNILIDEKGKDLLQYVAPKTFRGYGKV